MFCCVLGSRVVTVLHSSGVRKAGVNLEVYVDSDYASKAIDWRSDLGSVVMCTNWCFRCLFLMCVIRVYALHLRKSGGNYNLRARVGANRHVCITAFYLRC